MLRETSAAFSGKLQAQGWGLCVVSQWGSHLHKSGGSLKHILEC